MTKTKVKIFAALLGISMLATSLPVSATELAEPEDGTLSEESGIIDTTPPELTSLKFVKNEAGYMEFVATGTDDMSGLTNVYIRFDGAIYGYIDSTKTTTANGITTIWGDIVPMYSEMSPGTYDVYYVRFYDNAGNAVTYYKEDLPEGFDKSVELVDQSGNGWHSSSSSSSETTSYFKTLTLDKAEIEAPGSINVKATYYEDANVGKTDTLFFYLYNEAGSMMGGSDLRVILQDEDGDGEYTGTLEIPVCQEVGTYKMYQGYADEYYGSAEVKNVSFTVTSSKTDTKAPEAKSIEIKSNTLSVPGSIEVVADLSDDLSGVELVYISFGTEKGKTLTASCSLKNNFGEPYEDGLYHGFITTTQYYETAKYTINEVRIHDKAGNVIYYDKNTAQESRTNIGSKESVTAPLKDNFKDLSFMVKNDSDDTDKMTTTVGASLVDDIKAVGDNATISIDITGNSILPKEALEAIRGTNKTLLLNTNLLQWVIKGSDVTNITKDIDLGGEVLYRLYSPYYEEKYSDLLPLLEDVDTICIAGLSHQGALPCKATIRVIQNNFMGMPSSGINIYYFDENTKTLQLFAENAALVNGNNLEFEAIKGGTYVITPDKLDVSGVRDEEIPAGPSSWEGKEGTEGFVYRLYNVALTRDAEEAGLTNWNNKLQSKTQTAAEVAQGIFFSEEFQNHEYSDVQYVKLLYRTMFGREADESGLKGWIEKLNSGMSREYVFRGFAESQEFENLCKSYNIERGTVTLSQYRDKNEGATGYVARLYTKMLGRKYEETGIEYWCKEYLTGKVTIENIATNGFLHSQEFTNLNLSNEEFVIRMYQTFLNREPDMAGYKDWVGKLNSGEKTRDDLVYGFSLSQEFANLKKSYGL